MLPCSRWHARRIRPPAYVDLWKSFPERTATLALDIHIFRHHKPSDSYCDQMLRTSHPAIGCGLNYPILERAGVSEMAGSVVSYRQTKACGVASRPFLQERAADPLRPDITKSEIRPHGNIPRTGRRGQNIPDSRSLALFSSSTPRKPREPSLQRRVTLRHLLHPRSGSNLDISTQKRLRLRKVSSVTPVSINALSLGKLLGCIREDFSLACSSGHDVPTRHQDHFFEFPSY